MATTIADSKFLSREWIYHNILQIAPAEAADEAKKVERFVPGVPVTTLIVGEGEGRVAINKLQRTMKKLPKQISNNQLREVRSRLKAVGGMNMPIPKGPMPRNLRVPKM